MKNHALENESCAFTVSLWLPLKVVICHDRVIKIQFAVFVGGEMFAGFAGNIYRTGFICALAAILWRVGAAVFGYIFIS